MDDETLRIEVRHVDHITVVIVTGDIDAHSMVALQAPLYELNPESHIVVDMSGVRFMDSSGLKVILTQRARMTETGGSIYIRHPSPAVQRVIEVSGLTDFLCEPNTPDGLVTPVLPVEHTRPIRRSDPRRGHVGGQGSEQPGDASSDDAPRHDCR